MKENDLAYMVQIGIRECNDLKAENKTLKAEVERVNGFREALREKAHNLQDQINEYDAALHEQTGYEGDDPPWDVMRSEFATLKSDLSAAQKRIELLEKANRVLAKLDSASPTPP